jgi:hypothetical protein
MNDSLAGLRSSDFQIYFNRVAELKNHFLGVKAINQIPKKFPLKKFIILNLSPSTHPGTHWVVLLRPHGKELELFNSLGFENLEEFKPYLNFTFKAELTYNNTPVQLPSSSTCGLFCIYFAAHRLFNLDESFEEFLEENFSTSLIENENKVAAFCRHLLNVSDDAHLFNF